MRSPLAALLIALACSSSSAPPVCRAEWNPSVPVLAAPGDQLLSTMVPDGSGGVVLAGYAQGTPSWAILAQRVSADGSVASGWPTSGVTVFATNVQVVFSVVAVPDAAGGAIIAWGMRSSGVDRVYLQRIAASGAVAPGWPASARDVSTASSTERDPVIASDGAGGAFVAWNAASVKVQHVAADGANAAGWPAAGISLTPTSTSQTPAIAPDGSGGAIIAWTDYRNISVTGHDIYAQRLTSSGAVAPGWPSDGVPLCRAPENQGTQYGNLVVIPDGNHGAIVGWWDHRADSSFTHPYAQRVLSDGSIAPGWDPDGMALSLANNSSTGGAGRLQGVDDGSGGAIFTWNDFRNPSPDLYGQRLTGSGGIASGWPVEGLGLCVAANSQTQGASVTPIISDDFGGAIVTWSDTRRTPCCPSDVYAIRVTGDGSSAPGWSANGNPLYWGGQASLPFIAPDGHGGFITAWHERRGDAAEGADWYALHASGQGEVTAIPSPDARRPSGFAMLPPSPNPAFSASRIQMDLPEAGRARVEILDLEGRRVRDLVGNQVLPAGRSSWIWDGRTDRREQAVAGVYFVRATFMGQTIAQKLLLVR